MQLLLAASRLKDSIVDDFLA